MGSGYTKGGYRTYIMQGADKHNNGLGYTKERLMKT